MGRVDPSATAFAHRAAPFALYVLAGRIDPQQDEEITDWVLQLHQAMTPYLTVGV